MGDMLGISVAQISENQSMISRVYAQDAVSEDALFKQMIAQAGKAYSEHRFLDAIKHFEDAMLLRVNPNIHWNLSVCYYKLKNLQKSLYHINLYLKLGNPNEDMKRKVEQRRLELLRELKRRLDGTSKPSIVSPDSMPQNSDYNGANLEDSLAQDSTKDPAMTPQSAYERKLLLWGIAAVGSFALSAGIHLYADSIWASRPSGGGSIAQEARRHALITSWTGDGFLVLGLTAAVIGGMHYWDQSTSSKRVEATSCSKCSEIRDDRLVSRWGLPTLQLIPKTISSATSPQQQPHKSLSRTQQTVHYVDAIFGWRFAF
jgi:hypothetical protein